VQIPDEAQTHFFILVSKYLGVSALIMIPHAGCLIEGKERGGSKDTNDVSAILRLKRMNGEASWHKRTNLPVSLLFPEIRLFPKDFRPSGGLREN